MLLGKRPRAPVIRRTTSMSGGMAVDMHHEEVMHTPQPQDEKGLNLINEPPLHVVELVVDQTKNDVFETKGYEYEECLVGTTTNNHHRHNQTANPSHVIHTPHFLRTCGLCRCRLAPGRDIYMYRGDTAFCSSECREKQMRQDQRKEKFKVASNKEENRASPPPSTVKASTKSETAACT